MAPRPSRVKPCMQLAGSSGFMIFLSGFLPTVAALQLAAWTVSERDKDIQIYEEQVTYFNPVLVGSRNPSKVY